MYDYHYAMETLTIVIDVKLTEIILTDAPLLVLLLVYMSRKSKQNA